MLSNLEEVKAREGKIISIGTAGDRKLMSLSESFVAIPRATWAMNPFLVSIPVQLLAYHIARQLNRDVDKPRNLAKSVTVE